VQIISKEAICCQLLMNFQKLLELMIFNLVNLIWIGLELLKKLDHEVVIELVGVDLVVDPMTIIEDLIEEKEEKEEKEEIVEDLIEDAKPVIGISINKNTKNIFIFSNLTTLITPSFDFYEALIYFVIKVNC
jgi:hypothetical protein